MNIENNVKDIISQKLSDGTIEKIVTEKFEEGIKNAMQDLFRSYGDINKSIKEKIKSVMIPYLENYDYSEYLIKLDEVLVNVLKNTTKENVNMLENFKDLMNTEDLKEIKLSEIFDRYIEYVGKNADTADLEVEYDDEPHYESLEVDMSVEYLEKRDWSSYGNAAIYFECAEQEDLNKEINLRQFRNYGWEITSPPLDSISSLRYLDSFQVFLMNLAQVGTKIIIDTESEEEYAEIEEEPEAYYE